MTGMLYFLAAEPSGLEGVTKTVRSHIEAGISRLFGR